MNSEELEMPGVFLFSPDVYPDSRGFFKEIYSRDYYNEKLNINGFVQDNISVSTKSVIRGLHFQKNRPQGKLVTCLSGVVFDVVACIDPLSEYYGQHVSAVLSGENHRQLWVPPGYAHGFCVISDEALFCYKCSEYFDSNDQAGIVWNDEQLAIPWPVDKPILSLKDQSLPSLSKAAELRL